MLDCIEEPIDEFVFAAERVVAIAVDLAWTRAMTPRGVSIAGLDMSL